MAVLSMVQEYHVLFWYQHFLKGCWNGGTEKNGKMPYGDCTSSKR